MRLSEQYSCKWPMIHFDRRLIRTNKAKSNRKGILGRTIHLNNDAIAAIESLKRPGRKPGDPVFPREGEKDRFDNRSWFLPCLQEAGIEDYVWHGNRHSFCSWLAMAGASIKEIQEAAGYETITMAARYSHLSPEHRQSVVERIAAAVTA